MEGKGNKSSFRKRGIEKTHKKSYRHKKIDGQDSDSNNEAEEPVAEQKEEVTLVTEQISAIGQGGSAGIFKKENLGEDGVPAVTQEVPVAAMAVV